MVKQKGSIGLIVLVALALLVAGVASVWISTNNTVVRQRTQIEKVYKDSENKLSGYTLSIMDMVQIPKMYVKDFKETVTAGIKSRSENDKNLIMKFAQEHNIPISDKVYLDIMAAMKAGRDEFKNAQSITQEACATYKSYTQQIPQKFFVSESSADRDLIEKQCTVISDAQTRGAFDTGIATKIDINK